MENKFKLVALSTVMDPLTHHEKIPFLVRSRQQQLDRLSSFVI